MNPKKADVTHVREPIRSIEEIYEMAIRDFFTGYLARVQDDDGLTRATAFLDTLKYQLHEKIDQLTSAVDG